MDTTTTLASPTPFLLPSLSPDSLSASALRDAFIARVQALYGKSLAETTDREKLMAIAAITRELISQNWLATKRQRAASDPKQVYYLSIEFLPGRLLESNLVNLGIKETLAQALDEVGVALAPLLAAEEDAGLGNGGLGRLAACYLDSMAALGLAGHGCGLRYRYGLFEQRILDGYQREYPDNWLRDQTYLWEYRRPAESVTVRFGGTVRVEANGRTVFIHENFESVAAVPYDVPIPGYHNSIVNTLRLWSAEADLSHCACSQPARDCHQVIAHMHECEALTDLLYPDDSRYEGKRLRLKQEYLLVSASVQSIVRQFRQNHSRLQQLPDKVAIHINDTHPALAVPELMRILLDEAGLDWDEAWDITVRTLSYTNHTVLPEALEKWPASLLKELLPRIYMLIEEIHERHCRELWHSRPDDWERIHHMSILADGQVHMAHLAIVGSHSVNGVAKIHTDILTSSVMRRFYEHTPDKFTNITNGITHRRWLLAANPRLADLITQTIGPDWVTDPCQLSRLAARQQDAPLLETLAKIKQHNKRRLADHIQTHYGITLDPDSMFDVHVKRIHAYKRQLLNALHIMLLYNRLRENPQLDLPPRTFLFAGKAAPGYYQAKAVIKLITALADKINNDSTLSGRLKVLFLENYNVSLAELIMPAADVSEQIATASREASGTGNMKFMMNGALTVGTLDGANIEIREAAGPDNFFAFGLTAPQVLSYYQHGGYNPWEVYHSEPQVKEIVDQLVNGFLPVPTDTLRPLYDALLYQGDEYFVLKDLASYSEAQNRVATAYTDPHHWQTMCLMNIAHSGQFASDRTFAEYATRIWAL